MVALTLRGYAIAARYNGILNRDVWDGELPRNQSIIDFFKDETNNAIILSGDVHNSYLYSLLTNWTDADSAPAAVNVGSPGVTNGGIGAAVVGFLAPFLRGNTTLAYTTPPTSRRIPVPPTLTPSTAASSRQKSRATATLPSSPGKLLNRNNLLLDNYTTAPWINGTP